MARPSNSPEPSPTQDAWRTMCELVRAQDRKDEASSAVGLSLFRLKALRRLAKKPLTLRELAAASSVDPPYATVMVDDLEARGFVTREPHPTDRRARLVTISPLGLRAARTAEAILLTPPPSMAALSPRDLASLRRILAVIAEET